MRLWTVSGAGMLALHLGTIAAVLLWSPRPAVPPMPPEAMIIDLAPMPETVPDPPVSRPQKAAPEKMPLPPVPVRQAEVAPPKPKVSPVPSVQPPKAAVEAAPANTEPAENASPVPSPAARPVAVSPSPREAVATWQSRLLAHLERYKRYPAAARARRQEGVTTIRFVMDGSGTVVSAKLERSAGYSLLDEEGVALLERAQPLPPPPPEMGNGRIELVVPIQFFLKEGR